MDEEISDKRAVWEMAQSKGWEVVKESIKDDIEYCRNKLATLNLEGKNTNEVVSDYLQIREEMNAYQSILEKVKSLKGNFDKRSNS